MRALKCEVGFLRGKLNLCLHYNILMENHEIFNGKMAKKKQTKKLSLGGIIVPNISLK
jgi:hypothetical protein